MLASSTSMENPLGWSKPATMVFPSLDNPPVRVVGSSMNGSKICPVRVEDENRFFVIASPRESKPIGIPRNVPAAWPVKCAGVVPEAGIKERLKLEASGRVSMENYMLILLAMMLAN